LKSITRSLLDMDIHDIYNLITAQFDTFSPAEKRVARMLLADYPMSGLNPISVVAREASVSGPTVLRFINKLGYRRYAEFQEKLKTDLDQRMKGPLLVDPAGKDVDPEDAATYLSHFSRELQRNIDETFRSLPLDEVEAVLELFMDTKKHIHIMGGQFTENLARHLYFHLRKMRPGVSMIFGQSVSRIDLLLDLGRKDVLVVFDVRRYQLDVLELVTRAAAQADRVVLITDEWLSPGAKAADHVLSCKVSSPSRWDSLVAMSAVVEALISEFMDRRWPDVQQRLSRIEEIRDELFSGGDEEHRKHRIPRHRQ